VDALDRLMGLDATDQILAELVSRTLALYEAQEVTAVVCNCGRRISHAGVVTNHSRWVHVDDLKPTCANGDRACPNQDKTFEYTEKLLAGLRGLRSLNEDTETPQ
jgi:hypothetical protein